MLQMESLNLWFNLKRYQTGISPRKEGDAIKTLRRKPQIRLKVKVGVHDGNVLQMRTKEKHPGHRRRSISFMKLKLAPSPHFLKKRDRSVDTSRRVHVASNENRKMPFFTLCIEILELVGTSHNPLLHQSHYLCLANGADTKNKT